MLCNTNQSSKLSQTTSQMRQSRLSSSTSYTPRMSQGNQLGYGPLSQQSQQPSHQRGNRNRGGHSQHPQQQHHSQNSQHMRRDRTPDNQSRHSNTNRQSYNATAAPRSSNSRRPPANYSLSQDYMAHSQPAPIEQPQTQQRRNERTQRIEKSPLPQPTHFHQPFSIQQQQPEEIPQKQGLSEEVLLTEMELGIRNAISQLGVEREYAQSNIVQEVFSSQKFVQVRDNFNQQLDTMRGESEDQMDKLTKELDSLVKHVKINRKEYKKQAKERKEGRTTENQAQRRGRRGVAATAASAASQEKKSGAMLEITDDLLNLFVRFDVQRRFFNIVTMEILAQQFGLKEPPSLKQLKKESTKVSMTNLIMNGRNLTLEQYFEIKEDFEKNSKAKEQLIRDRQTFSVYGSSSEGDKSCSEDERELTDEDNYMDYTTTEVVDRQDETNTRGRKKDKNLQIDDEASSSSDESERSQSQSDSASSSDSDRPAKKKPKKAKKATKGKKGKRQAPPQTVSMSARRTGRSTSRESNGGNQTLTSFLQLGQVNMNANATTLKKKSGRSHR